VKLRLAADRAEVAPPRAWPACAALAAGLAYAGISIYWGLGGTSLINTIGAGADHRALAWHAYLGDPWFLLRGLLVTAALLPGGRPHAAFPAADATER